MKIYTVIKKIPKKYLIAAILLILISIVAIQWYMNKLLHDPFKGYPEDEKFIIIKRGTSIIAITATLINEGVLEDDRGFRLALRKAKYGKSLQAGEYHFTKPMSPMEVYEKLAKGKVYYHRFTIAEGKDIFDIANQLEESGLGNADGFLETVADPALIKDIDPKATNLEGYLFPDTYLLSRAMSTADIAKIMVRNFRSKYADRIKPEIEKSTLTLRDVIIIASLIEKETSLPEERSSISSVVHNRLRIKMGLHIDPTIIYALKSSGNWDGNIRRKDKHIDSPYNTYRYRGLPPSPICNPGLASIKAAINPEKTKYLYYVSKNDGSHVFSTNLKDHNKAVYIWQKKYWIKKWREERKRPRTSIKQ